MQKKMTDKNTLEKLAVKIKIAKRTNINLKQLL